MRGQDGKAYLILIGTLYASKERSCASPPISKRLARVLMYFNAKKRQTIQGLSKIYKLPEDNLAQCGMKYNAAAKNEIECEFQKNSKDMKDLKPPFYIMDISIDSTTAPLPCLTLGGLKVNEDTGEVLNQLNEEIPGLYAAGRTAIGICSNIYVSGLSVADCIFSGRRIGQNLN